MKYLSCREAGKDCDFIARGNSELEVMQSAMDHAREVHGAKDSDFTQNMQDKLRDLIHDEKEEAA